MEKLIVKASNNYNLSVHVFDSPNPRGYVQIIHGMEEHQERYEMLAKHLNQLGYTVISSNMRGHGENAPLLGYFAKKDGYKLLIEDQKLITKYIKETYKINQIIIFAHSMGTIITRNLLRSESKDYSKVILSGYPCYNRGAKFGIFLCNVIMLFKGSKYYSKFIANISTGSFNKKIKNPETQIDWVSVNKNNIKDYLEDPYCGHGFKVSAYKDLFKLVILMHKPKLYKNVNEKLELLLLRGAEDPCTGYDKGALDSIKTLKKAGFKNIIDYAFLNMRHEILNEIDNEKVYEKLDEFLK